MDSEFGQSYDLTVADLTQMHETYDDHETHVGGVIEYATALKEKLVVFNGCYPDRYQLSEIVETFKSEYFPNLKTVMVPKSILMTAAFFLRPFSLLGLGIHPERITKLVRSTDIFPGWLDEQGQAERGKLKSALKRWSVDSNGTFT